MGRKADGRGIFLSREICGGFWIMEGEKGCSGGTDGQGPVLLDVAQGPEQAVL